MHPIIYQEIKSPWLINVRVYEKAAFLNFILKAEEIYQIMLNCWCYDPRQRFFFKRIKQELSILLYNHNANWTYRLNLSDVFDFFVNKKEISWLYKILQFSVLCFFDSSSPYCRFHSQLLVQESAAIRLLFAWSLLSYRILISGFSKVFLPQRVCKNFRIFNLNNLFDQLKFALIKCLKCK